MLPNKLGVVMVTVSDMILNTCPQPQQESPQRWRR
jgi:hypothetical protein